MAHPLLLQLHELQNQLTQLGMWQQSPIDAAALNSDQPFCVDTMSFPQWLQFILVPRLTALVEGNLPLPRGSQIYPMAELYFTGTANANPVLQVIQDIDVSLGVVE